VVGYAVATRTYDVYRTSGNLRTSMYVTPMARERGHERALLQFLANQGQSHGYAHLLIHPDCAVGNLAKSSGHVPTRPVGSWSGESQVRGVRRYGVGH